MEHYVPLDDNDDFVEKINFCLSDSNIINNIRDNVFNYVISNHTYDKRSEQILKLIM